MSTRHCFLPPIEKSLIFFFVLLISLSLTAAWCDAEQGVNDRFERGVRYLEAEQYDLALAEFLSIEQEFGTSADIRSLAQYYIGFVHQELNDLSPAASAYQEALALKAPQEVHANTHLQLGIVYKLQGKLSLAENHLKQSLILLPAAGQSHTHLGDVYLLQRRFNAAEKAYGAGIRLNPNHTESYYGLGRVAEMQNRLQQAIEYYDAALVRNRYASQTHYRRALTYQKLGDKAQAAAAMAQFQRLKTYEDQMHRFREGIYNNPNLPVLYIKLGELHEAYDNLTEAAQIYEVATQVHPSYLPAYLHLGEVFIEQRALEKAVRVYQKAAEVAPDNAHVQIKLGVIYINQHQFEPAIAAFKRAIAVDKTAAEAYNNLARLYAGLGQEMQQAIYLAQQAVALAPTAKYYDTLAYTYYRNAQYMQALDAINQAISLAPNVEAYSKLRAKIQKEKK
ncbi:tetratricopeptide repeat protein [Candidatus Poribacteria bacterium]|nr:tetratricopeptide repeat protein [Candidatus Poribacteria bacterium]MYG06026.1 tetratricopeptide repeat protein [Candidatus Poribacteria bacterium]MYK20730.1 tetratricopeptide repeat protein [Candidatus Poribacteria bacterium]